MRSQNFLFTFRCLPLFIMASCFALPFVLAFRFALNMLDAKATAVCLVGSSVVGTWMISPVFDTLALFIFSFTEDISPVCSFPIFGHVSLFLSDSLTDPIYEPAAED